MILPFTGEPRLPNLDYVFTVNTPHSGVSGRRVVLWGKDENFFEWSSADIVYLTFTAHGGRPEQLRVSGNYQLQSFDRRTDGSTVGIRRIPRAQGRVPALARHLRARGGRVQRELPGRPARRLAHRAADRDTGSRHRRYARPGTRRANFRLDFLFSYQPTPGTVFFAGYGSTLADRTPTRRELRRESDGFFLKISYLFRL